MLFSNNVNLRPGEQYAIDAIQQQLLSAILGFEVATSASGLAPSLSGPVTAAAATRTIRTHALIDRYLAEQQAVWSAGPRRPVTLPGPGPLGKCSTSPTHRVEPH
ncbi:hypothetical protein DPMN_006034 [Dreissena polymorpha]|uniref:Uncharacterized protein n=1 Tax=Dreissena polymorpha TaxID=45954 RepID=A0A9D4RX47_DREPO|nr:hypothetical protein DPMN_006034 [Dreissena polymorpha]